MARAVTAALQVERRGRLRLLFPNARMCGQCSYGPVDHAACADLTVAPRRAGGRGAFAPLRGTASVEQQQPPHRQCVPAVRLVRADDQPVADVERRPPHAGRRLRRGSRCAAAAARTSSARYEARPAHRAIPAVSVGELGRPPRITGGARTQRHRIDGRLGPEERAPEERRREEASRGRGGAAGGRGRPAGGPSRRPAPASAARDWTGRTSGG